MGIERRKQLLKELKEQGRRNRLMKDAAPDMLCALRAVREAVEMVIGFKLPQSIMDRVVKAIDKAEGRA